ncbi:hypothetical protein G7Y89_g7431 [Cudoniella acicularis]|uniref:Uncharacterized protein n=1 Tax=Cudoniella acicularis TaxID=354080 RepID=A0A8H4RK46_9HELO|nr:hypothetical protein G7Y89_g7431 [Cudoniella acicularis]
MFTKTFLISAFAALSLADPVPAPQAIPTDLNGLTSLLPTDTAVLASLEAEATSVLAIFSDFPTLASSVESVLETAIPTNLQISDIGCQLLTATPAWYTSLPAGVQSALTSYELAAESWYSAHSSQINALTSELGTELASYTSGVSLPVAATGCVASVLSSITSGPTAGSGSKNGTVTTGSVGATGTAGSAGASSTLHAGAAKPTGAVVASLAGVLGIFGVMIAL